MTSNVTIEDICEINNIIYPGAHIAVPFEIVGTNALMWHHGIYIGNRKIIDLSNNHSGVGDIQEKSVISFVKDNLKLPGNTNLRYSFALIHYPNDSDESQLRTVHVAKTLLIQSAQNPHKKLYHLANSNSETFATLCRTGQLNYLPHSLPKEFFYLSQQRKRIS